MAARMDELDDRVNLKPDSTVDLIMRCRKWKQEMCLLGHTESHVESEISMDDEWVSMSSGCEKWVRDRHKKQQKVLREWAMEDSIIDDWTSGYVRGSSDYSDHEAESIHETGRDEIVNVIDIGNSDELDKNVAVSAKELDSDTTTSADEDGWVS
jgi:hypothetical protein